MTSESTKLVEAIVNEVDVEHALVPPTRIQSFKIQISQLVKPTKPFLPLLDIPFVEKSSIQKLPAQDGGWPAWRVLIGCTVQISFVSGFYLAFGVFHDYYTLHAAFEHGSQSAWIGVLSSGLPFLGAPALVWLCTHRPLARIHYVWSGFIICVCSLVGAAFSTSIPTLIVTQGLLFGVGILLMDNPVMIILNSWWVKKRGIAYGILFGVCDLFGVGWSFLASYLLLHLGLRKTMLIFAAIVFAVSGPCLFFLGERGAKSIFSPGLETPTPQTPRRGSGTPKRYEKYAIITKYSTKRFYHCWLFYLLAAANLTHACAYYLPFIYLPSFTTALGYSSGEGALVLAIANFAQIFGEVGFGLLSDHVNVHVLIVVSTTTTAISTFLLWGFANNLAMLIAFALLFGTFGAGLLALWARIGTLFGEKDAPMVYGVLCCTRGIGSIASGPISLAMLGGEVVMGTYGAGKFKSLVLFVGLCLTVSAGLGSIGLATTVRVMFGGRQSKQRNVVESTTNQTERQS